MNAIGRSRIAVWAAAMLLAAGCSSTPNVNERQAMLRATPFGPEARVAVVGTMVAPPYIEVETRISAADMAFAELQVVAIATAELPATVKLWSPGSVDDYGAAASVRLRTFGGPGGTLPAPTGVNAQLERAAAQGYRAFISFTMYAEMAFQEPSVVGVARTRESTPLNNMGIYYSHEIMAASRYPYSREIQDASGAFRRTRTMRVQSVAAWISMWRLPGKELVLYAGNLRTQCPAGAAFTSDPERAIADGRPCLDTAGKWVAEALRYELSLR